MPTPRVQGRFGNKGCPVMDYQVSKLAALMLGLALSFPAALAAAPGDDQFAVAAGHYTRGRWELAADEFAALLADYPDHAKRTSALFYRGEALVQLGKFDEAHAAFDEFLRAAPEDSRARQALFRAGETSYLGGKSTAATTELTRFAERYPDDELNGYVIAYLGDLALDAEDWSGARRFYQQALDKFPTGPLADDCRYGLGRALQRLDQRQAAEGLFAEIAGKSANGHADEAQYQLGSAQYARGDYAAAAKSLGEFAARAPQHPWSEQARLAAAWSHYRLQDYAAAEELLQQLTASPQRGLEARYWLGLTQKARGDWAAAAATLSTAATDAANDPLAAAMHFHAGEAWLRAAQPKEADAEFARVIADFPSYEWVDACWLGRCRAALAAGNHALVDHHAAYFSEQCPQSDKRWGVARVRADSLIARKDYRTAISLLESLVANDPDAGAAASHQLALAVAYLGDSRADDALTLIELLPAEASPEVRDESQLTRVQALVALARFAEAEPLVAERLTRETNVSRLAMCRAQLAICLARTGQLDRAKQEFARLAEAQPDAELLAGTASYLAEVARAAGDRAWSDDLLARATSERVPATYAGAALANRGWDEFQTGEYERAAETLGRLLDKFPAHPSAAQAALLRGRALEKLDRSDEALAAYRRVVEMPGDQDVLPQALLSAARLLDRQGQHTTAAANYERLLREFPEFGQRDAVLYESAWTLLALDQADEAEQRFGRLERECPQSKLAADARFRLAEQARKRKDFARAETLLTELVASEIDPALLEHVLYARGELAATREQWEEVAPPLEQLRAEFPASELRLLADYWLAEAAYRLKRYDDARQRFATLAEQTVGRQESWVALAALRRAQLAARADEWQLARELAEPIPSLYPDFEQLYEVDYVLGRALAGQRQYENARAAYRRVLSSSVGGKTETAAMAQWMIGETYLHEKEYRAALKEFLRLEILFAYPTWQSGALLQAGKCQELLGHVDEAAELYDRVLKEFPASEFAAEAQQRLKAVGGTLERSATRPRLRVPGPRS